MKQGYIKILLHRPYQKRWAAGIFLGVFLLSFNIIPAKSEPIFKIDSAHSIAKASTINKSVAQGKSVTSVEDSGRLTKKIVPVIQKSFNRYPTFYLFMFIGGFVLFALIRLIDPSYLNSVFTSAANSNLLLNLFGEGVFGFNITGLLLDVVCICMTALYIQIFFFSASPDLFLWILGFTSIAYILKLILIQFLANVFMNRLEALMHLLMHLLFTRILGLILLPLLFVALYQPVFNVQELLRSVLIGISVLYLAWLIRLFAKMKSIATVNPFYLFLYLCTVELSTLAILLRNYI